MNTTVTNTQDSNLDMPAQEADHAFNQMSIESTTKQASSDNTFHIVNARIVLHDKVINGSVYIENGIIQKINQEDAEIDNTNRECLNKNVHTFDFSGDYLLPGLIELHTDNLEKHFMPRPKVMWPSQPAVIAHDSQLINSGITTVFDAVSVGEVSDKSNRVANLKPMLQALNDAQDLGILRAEHFIHLRCELSYPKMMDLFDELVKLPNVHLVSLMDHSPGQRQFADIEHYKIYYQGKFGFSDDELANFMSQQITNSKLHSEKHRINVVNRCHELDIPLMSHDDATPEHVKEALEMGIVMAEFPTTKSAAKASHQAGLGVLMGAPNVVRGGSHSGNIAAHELASEDVLDILSSDYCPTSLLHAAFILAKRSDNDYDIPKAFRTVSYNPARFSGLNDRGNIEVGKRADLLRVTLVNDMPYLKRVWCSGNLAF